MMGVKEQFGTLKEGRRADFVVLEEDGSVRETWVGGRRVWSQVEGFQSWSPHD
jgi:N-acetylglucosamine-6-phosphate deacetylase